MVSQSPRLFVCLYIFVFFCFSFSLSIVLSAAHDPAARPSLCFCFIFWLFVSHDVVFFSIPFYLVHRRFLVMMFEAVVSIAMDGVQGFVWLSESVFCVYVMCDVRWANKYKMDTQFLLRIENCTRRYDQHALSCRNKTK